MGLKIYGSPWQPDFSQSAFSLQRGDQLRNKWEWPSHTHTHLFNNQSFKVYICFFAKVVEDSWGCPSVSLPRPSSWGWRPLQWLGGESRWQKVKVAECKRLSFFLMRKNMAWGEEQRLWKEFFATSSKFSVSVIWLWRIAFIFFLAGCEDLLKIVTKVVQPKLHIFGLIYEGGKFWNYKIASSLLYGFSLHGTLVPQRQGVICWLSDS